MPGNHVRQPHFCVISTTHHLMCEPGSSGKNSFSQTASVHCASYKKGSPLAEKTPRRTRRKNTELAGSCKTIQIIQYTSFSQVNSNLSRRSSCNGTGDCHWARGSTPQKQSSTRNSFTAEYLSLRPAKQSTTSYDKSPRDKYHVAVRTQLRILVLKVLRH